MSPKLKLATTMALIVFFVWAKTPSVALNKTVALGDLERSLKAAKDGDTLFLAEGDYKLAHLVNVQKSISLVGMGATKTRVISSLNQEVMRFNGVSLSLKGIGFVHSGKQKADVLNIVDSKIKIDDCSFSGAFSPDSPAKVGDGIWIHGRSSGKISNSQFMDNSLRGLEITDNSNLELDHVQMSHNRSGLSLYKNGKVRVVNSVFQFNTYSGITFANASSGSVMNNTIESDNYGIEILDSSTVSVSNNKISLQKEAIYVAKKAHATIGENTFESNGSDVVYEK
jgi:parallel beta-helix repeat protein